MIQTMIDLDGVDEYHASLPRVEARASRAADLRSETAAALLRKRRGRQTNAVSDVHVRSNTAHDWRCRGFVLAAVAKLTSHHRAAGAFSSVS
jgi:hypothetical protein